MTSNVYGSIHAWLMDWLVNEFGPQARELSDGASFLSFGMNSIQATMLVGDAEARLSLRLKPTLVWDFPTIGALTSYLVERMAAEPAKQGRDGQNVETASPASAALPAIAESPKELLGRLNELSEDEIDALLARYQPQST